MRILLIEDDVKLCEVLLPSLEEGGFKADCCHSGAEGLELLRRGYYDACILDRMLPELNASRCSRSYGARAAMCRC